MKKYMICLALTILLANYAKADEWRMITGRANDIAVGANGKVWIVGNTATGGGFNIQTWNGSNWETIDGGAIRIAVDPNGNPWVINSGNQIFRRESNRWIEMPGRAVDIGIGADGSVWIINLQDPRVIPVPGSTIKLWGGSSWTDIGGGSGASRISVGPNGKPFIVTSDGVIQEKLQGGEWVTYPGRAKDISVGANGSVWVIGSIPRSGSYTIHKWNVDAWEEVDGGGTQIAVDPAGKPWITNHLFEIYKRNYTAPAYSSRTTIAPIVHDYPYTGAVSSIAVNPNNHNHLLLSSGSGGVYETFNAMSATRTWSYNGSLTNPNVYDLIFTTPASSITAWAATGETFKNASTPQIWAKSRTGFWSLARFAAGTNIPTDKTSCYKITKAQTGIYYACGDFGIAFYEESRGEWKMLDFPSNVPVYSIASLKNGTLVAGTASGIYNFSPYGGAFGREPRWSITNAAAIFTDPVQRYQLNSDFSNSVVLYVNRRISNNIFYSDDGTSWVPVLNVPPLDPKGEGAGGFESIYADSLITGNYSILVSNKFKFYQANIYGTSTLQGLEDYRNRGQQLQWNILDPASAQTHDDTRHFLKLRGTDGSNKIVMTTDGGFHISNFNYATPGGYSWQTERTRSGLNNLEVYNLTGTNSIINFGTQHNSFGALNSTFGLIGWGLNEGYVLDRRGLGDTDPRTIVYAPGTGLKVEGRTFGTLPFSICGAPATDEPHWKNPNNGWGNPIWLGNRIYIQDAAPVESRPGIFPWKISTDNGCTWQNLPDGNTVRSGCNSQFSIRNNVEQNLYVGLVGSGGIKLGKLINPNISSIARWVYPAMSGLEGGICYQGADFLYLPVFCVNPFNPDHILAVEAATGKLKVSDFGGDRWIDAGEFNHALTVANPSSLKGSKRTYSIKSMKFSPYDSNIILIGTTTEGLFLSRTSGLTWERISSPGLFNITDFHWRTPNSIIISTYGHGLFHLNM